MNDHRSPPCFIVIPSALHAVAMAIQLAPALASGLHLDKIVNTPKAVQV